MLQKAEQIQGQIKVAKMALKGIDDPTIAYANLATKIDHGDNRYFCIQSGSMVIKEKSNSTDILYKLKFELMQTLLVLTGVSSIAFNYLGEAWMIYASKEDQLRLWAMSLLLLTEEAAKQHEAPSFPKFEVIESIDSAVVDFDKDEVSYDYLPLTYKKARTMTMKAFDTSAIDIESPTKRERAVEVLSDDD